MSRSFPDHVLSFMIVFVVAVDENRVRWHRKETSRLNIPCSPCCEQSEALVSFSCIALWLM